MICPVPVLTMGLQVAGCTAEGEAAVGDICTYSCMSGYTISGDAMVTCGSYGTFSPAIPTCDGKNTQNSMAIKIFDYYLAPVSRPSCLPLSHSAS